MKTIYWSMILGFGSQQCGQKVFQLLVGDARKLFPCPLNFFSLYKLYDLHYVVLGEMESLLSS
jgi:hypothetical protein